MQVQPGSAARPVHVPHGRLASGCLGDPRGCHFPFLLAASVHTLHEGSAQINFLYCFDWDSDILCHDLPSRPLCPSGQRPCQEKPLVAAPWSVVPSNALPEMCWPVLHTQARKNSSHQCILVPLPAKRTVECAPAAGPPPASPGPTSAVPRGLSGSAFARPACLRCRPYSGDRRDSAAGCPDEPPAPQCSWEPRPLRPRERRHFPPGRPCAEHAQCASWKPALAQPGSSAPGFRGCRGHWGRRLGAVSALFLSGCGRRTARFRPIRGRRRGWLSRPPSGLIELYRNSVPERRGRRRERAEARERGRACQTGRERPRVSEARKK